MLCSMDEATFWQLIEVCSPPDPDPEAELLAPALTARLLAGPVEDVIGFAEQLSRALYLLDTEEHCGDELSGDAFLYARAAVVAAGRQTYEDVLREPARFRPYAEELIWAESLLYVPDEAYRELTGKEWDRATRHSYESFSNTDGWPTRQQQP